MIKPALIAAAALAGTAAACSEARGEDPGPPVSRSYQVGAFNQIELAGRYDVEVRTGSAASVSARGPEKLMERLEVEVRGDTVGSSRVDLQACKLEYSIVSPK